MKKVWTVRVVLNKRKPDADDRRFVGCGVDLLITEVLRYAGVVTVIKDTDTTLVFDIHRAEARGDQMWAEMNARRISSFGLNAAATPKVV